MTSSVKPSRVPYQPRSCPLSPSQPSAGHHQGDHEHALPQHRRGAVLCDQPGRAAPGPRQEAADSEQRQRDRGGQRHSRVLTEALELGHLVDETVEAQQADERDHERDDLRDAGRPTTAREEDQLGQGLQGDARGRVQGHPPGRHHDGRAAPVEEQQLVDSEVEAESVFQKRRPRDDGGRRGADADGGPQPGPRLRVGQSVEAEGQQQQAHRAVGLHDRLL
ncbi:hypothetical protein [Streptomyces sp. NPDC005302]|uniref:hypothetical protein n=1 Tax=Streptomyces sp. NPDC005302 TaxID=3154675 RepID=UPI00339DF2B8